MINSFQNENRGSWPMGYSRSELEIHTIWYRDLESAKKALQLIVEKDLDFFIKEGRYPELRIQGILIENGLDVNESGCESFLEHLRSFKVMVYGSVVSP